MNLLLKIFVSVSILITIFSSWIQCIWGGVTCKIFAASFLAVLHHKFQHGGRNCCHFFSWSLVSDPFFFSQIAFEQCVSPIATPATSYCGKNSQAFRGGDLAGHSMLPPREITWAGNITLGTRIAVLVVWVVPCLASTGESGFQHQVSANPVPEMCETSQCIESNLPWLLYCFVFKGIGADLLKMLHQTKE
jgi:hypothetical protein